MATREATAQRRTTLLADLRADIRSGKLSPGAMIPPVRVLARRYDLALATVAKELQRLIHEGLLTSTSRVGVFVATSARLCPAQFVLLAPPIGSNLDRVRQGFEQRIAQLGASTVVLPADDIESLARVADIDELAGVFDPCCAIGCDHPKNYDWGVPTVAYSYPFTNLSTTTGDAVQIIRFNDTDGGRQATEHLVHHGHRRIAFLGCHTDGSAPLRDQWSSLRGTGWASTLQRFGLSLDGLEFRPSANPATGAGRPDVDAVARHLATVPDITAVVGATDQLIMMYLRALEERGVPAEDWPAVVGFDDDPSARRHVVSSLQLPWERVGHTAADVLWRRYVNVRPSEPSLVEVPMTLISRASSMSGWFGRIPRNQRTH